MKKEIITSILISICSFVYSQNTDNRLKGLDKEIEELMSMYNAVGVAVAVVENDSLIYSNGYGYRNRELKLKMNAETLLPIGSATKSFTGSVLGILENKELLSLKDKPSYHLKSLKFYNEKMNNLITIEDLLCHKSGMGSFDGSNTFFPTKNPFDFIPRLEYLKPNGEIKNSFLYSNIGFGICGLIIGSVCGDSWESSIQKLIFKPLGMKRSVTNISAMERDHNFGIGYGLSEGKQIKLLNRKFTISKAEGAIISSVNEMAKYLTAWLNRGEYNSKQIIPKKYVTEATTIKNLRPQNQANSDTYLYGYGYGWFIQSLKGHYAVEHGGNVPGFSTQIALYPYDGLGIIVITNQNNSALPYLIEDVITNRMLNLERTPIHEYEVHIAEIWNKVREIQPRNLEKPLTHQLSDYCGTFVNHGYGSITIEEENDDLYIKFPEHRFILEHQNFNNFIMVNTEEIPEVFGLPFFGLSFQIDFEGNISSLTIGLQREPVIFERK